MKQTVLRLSQAACGLAFFFGAALGAVAGSFSVSPVRATLSAGQPVAALTVRNTGSEPTVIQLEVVSWSQQGGKEVYAPTREILATPPIFTVPAGGSQVVRVGLRRSPDTQREMTYRLFLQEVPAPPKPGFQGLQVALRIGVPVFVMPAAAAAPVLKWQAFRSPQGQLQVRLSNTGNAHIQVASFTVASVEGADLGVHQVSSYVLPGHSTEWILKHSVATGTALKIFAKTDAGDVRAEVIVQEP